MTGKDPEIRYLSSLQSRLCRPRKMLAGRDLQAHLDAFCAKHSVIHASGDVMREQELLLGGMDVGEAILFTEAETTGGVVVTGDKRALIAYRKVSTTGQRANLQVICWEQLLLRVRQVQGFETLRKGCCRGMFSDKLLILAFSSGLATSQEHAVAAIRSYLDGVIEHSGDILVTFDFDA